MSKALTLSFLALLLCFQPAHSADEWTVISDKSSKKIRKGDREVRVWVAEFKESEAAMKIVDQGNSARERKYESLKVAMEKTGAIAGCNGGFFQKDFQPLGLSICDGVRIGKFSTSKLLSGVLFSKGGRISIVRRDAFRDDKTIDQLLQAGPMLVEDGQPVKGLHSDKQRARTVIFTDGKDHWAIALLRNASLFEVGEMLAQSGVLVKWKIQTALNLDGGTSSGFWKKGLYSSEWKRVRNFLAIVPK